MVLAAIRSLMEQGKWNAPESEIITLSRVARSTYYSVKDDRDIKLAMKAYHDRRVPGDPPKLEDF
jgi:hypothetical protein